MYRDCSHNQHSDYSFSECGRPFQSGSGFSLKSVVNYQDAVIEDLLIIWGKMNQENDKIVFRERISFHKDCDKLKL